MPREWLSWLRWPVSNSLTMWRFQPSWITNSWRCALQLTDCASGRAFGCPLSPILVKPLRGTSVLAAHPDLQLETTARWNGKLFLSGPILFQQPCPHLAANVWRDTSLWRTKTSQPNLDTYRMPKDITVTSIECFTMQLLLHTATWSVRCRE